MLQVIEKIHDEAMEIIDKSHIATLSGDIELAKQLKLQAYEKEKEAANCLLNDYIEPSRSILFRSAASLAYDLGLFGEAEKLACMGLIGFPPEWVADELRDLYENINQGRHLDIKGSRLSDEEFQMSLTGNDVGYGFARFEDYLPRAEAISKLIQRTAQRKSQNGEFTKRIPKSIIDGFTPYISVPRAASFAVTFKIAVPGEQIVLFEAVPKKDIIKEVLECIELLENNKVEELRTKIDSKEYYDNFVGICDNLLPDGDSIKTVGFTYSSDSGEKRVVVKTVKEKLEVSTELPTSGSNNLLDGIKNGEEVTIRGILEVADKSKDKPEIQINCNDVLYRVRVPEGQIDDVVRPLWDKTVILKGKKYSKTIIDLEKIQEYVNE
ncbi:MAG: hypothetical protein Q8M98_11975 [Candidatus Cloacimonadaceae bacterium]|nr:hypothetical protein [Candidatus Cloacimonadaceae bacterium]